MQSPAAARCQTPYAEPRVDELPGRGGEMTDVRGAAPLVGDDRHLVPLRSETEHRADEVVPGLAEEPRRADDPGAVARRRLAGELRAAVRGERGGQVGLDVRRPFRPVEHVVGRVGDERRPERCHPGRPGDVRRVRVRPLLLRAVDIGPRGRVEDEVGRPGQRRRLGANVPAASVERDEIVVRERRGERVAELATRTRDQDTASRDERIGLSCSTGARPAESFHGTPCSSGSAGSYSSVTW